MPRGARRRGLFQPVGGRDLHQGCRPAAVATRQAGQTNRCSAPLLSLPPPYLLQKVAKADLKPLVSDKDSKAAISPETSAASFLPSKNAAEDLTPTLSPELKLFGWSPQSKRTWLVIGCSAWLYNMWLGRTHSCQKSRCGLSNKCCAWSMGASLCLHELHGCC